jgi:hypothetical protein
MKYIDFRGHNFLILAKIVYAINVRKGASDEIIQKRTLVQYR